LHSPLKTINLKGCLSLKYLDCAENSIEELILSNHPELNTVSSRNCRIKKLHINNCPNLSYLDFAFQQIFEWID